MSYNVESWALGTEASREEGCLQRTAGVPAVRGLCQISHCGGRSGRAGLEPVEDKAAHLGPGDRSHRVPRRVQTGKRHRLRWAEDNRTCNSLNFQLDWGEVSSRDSFVLGF